MKGVKGSSFGVRFYRRAGTKAAVKETQSVQVANAVESIDELEAAMSRAESSPETMEIHSTMTDIPPQTGKIILRPSADEVKKALQQKIGPGTEEAALWAAAKHGNCQRIRLLVLEGVDLDARDNQGRTAINIATQYSQHAALKTLLAAREMRRLAKNGDLPKTRFFERFSKTGTDNG